MKRIIFTLSAIVMFAASCDQHIDTPIYESNPDAVAFSAAIMPSTRATDTAFDSGDMISIYASSKGSLYSSNHAQNVKYTYYDGIFTTQEELTYPDKNTTLTFYAVYPYGSYTTPDFTFSVNKDQTTHASYTQSDLMTASNQAKNQEVVDLVFNHNLTKVIINLNSANLPAGTQSLTFKNVYSKATANLSSNTFKSTGSRTDIKASPNGTNSFKVIIPPQTIAKGELFAEITIGGDTYVWNVDRDLIFASGVEYVYNLSFRENSVSFQADINPWNEPSDIQAVIPQEYIDILGNYIPIYEGDTPPNIEGVWLMSPLYLYYDSATNTTNEDWNFADKYIWLYNQSSNNTINMKATQNLGDLSVADGVFVSGSGNNFTIYFSDYTTRSDGSWLVKATLLSGTKSGNYIKNMRNAFIVLDAYDPYEELMDIGDFRVTEDANYSSEQVAWPLNTKAIYVDGKLIDVVKK